MTSKRGIWIPVVTGILRKGNQVLVGQRPPGHSLPGLWEFPGGKIETNESPEYALKRELNEELGIEAEIGPLRLAASHSYGEVSILLIFYEINYWKGEPRPVHHSELKWIRGDELKTLNIPEANQKILDRLLRIMSA